MKRFQDGLKERAHLFKIKQAKTTIISTVKPQSKLSSSKVGAQANLLLQLYQKKNYDSIPAYKLLRTAGLQQYTRGFIQRGYGINLGKLALISQEQKKHLYQQLKILPGHTTKLDKIIDSLAKSSYLPNHEEMDRQSVDMPSKEPQKMKLKVLAKKDFDYERQLQRVLNEYTPQSSDNKKKSFNITKNSEKKIGSASNSNSVSNETKYVKTKYSANIKQRSADFKKKGAEISTKTTMKKTLNESQNKKESLARILRKFQKATSMSTKEVMEINLEIDKIKCLNRSFDGALMTSTIANIDVEELIYAFSGFVTFKVVVVNEPQTYYRGAENSMNNQGEDEEYIEDQVGQILKESFLHPLYKEQVQQELACEEDAYSQGEQDEENRDTSQEISREQESLQNKMMESSFLGGAQSVDFGMSRPLNIFDQPEPTAIDYFKPTIDSVSNFIKNIVLTAKMQRQIPIMAAAYLQNFIEKTKLMITSLNYKRLLVSVLLLASKIWDDESFQTPSFSKTFPQYSTVLLNEMQKQIVKALNYKLKIDKKEYTKIYFKMRKYTKENIKSYQNKKLTLKRIRELQLGVKKDYKSNFLTKRNSY